MASPVNMEFYCLLRNAELIVKLSRTIFKKQLNTEFKLNAFKGHKNRSL